VLRFAIRPPGLIAFVLAAAIPCHVGATASTAGTIVDPVVCSADPDRSYALYLPTRYSNDERWPALYLLDPRGRGRLAVELYREAAERHGYVLLGANDSGSDGPPQTNLDAMQALLDDSFARYAIDPERLYVAGMSGTARAGCEIAARAGGRISALILVGASCAPDPRLERGVDIDFLEVVGDTDFNYREVQLFDDRLDRLDRSHLLLTFRGPHGWHGPLEADRALEWVELRAMSRGLRPVDDAFVDARFEAMQAQARDAERDGRIVDAWYVDREMLRSFEGLRSLGDIRRRFTELGGETEVRRYLRRRRALLREEGKRIARGERILSAISGPDPRPAAETLARRLRIDRLKTASDASTDEGRLARRLLESIRVEVAFYLPEERRAVGDTEGVRLSLELASMIGPVPSDRPEPRDE
jgi:hypothetical protein